MGIFGSEHPYGRSRYKDDAPLTVAESDKLLLTNLDGTVSFAIPRPLMSYQAEIHMPIEVGKSQDGKYFFFDNGGDYDYRICTMRLQLPRDDKQALNDFLRQDEKSRGTPFLLRWEGEGEIEGDTAGGFYPFGPNWDCHDGVWVIPVEQEQGGVLWQPYNCFEDKLSLLILTGDNLPSGKWNNINQIWTDGETQGPMSIGNVGGIMFPQDLFKPKISYAYEVSVSKGGRHSAIGMVSDNYETSFTFTGNHGKAALLISYLTTTGRANDITMSMGSLSYPFGADCPFLLNTSYVKLLGSSHGNGEIVLKITHDSYNRFSMPLNFWLKS